MFLIDTDVISRTAPGSRRDPDVDVFLDKHWHESFVSVITLRELWFGAERLRARGASRKASELAPWIDDVENSYADRLLSVDRAIGRRTGELMARAEASGHAPGYPDACIAATAALNGLTIVTFNLRHFSVFGVPHRSPLGDLS